jgi:hypothetical protein
MPPGLPITYADAVALANRCAHTQRYVDASLWYLHAASCARSWSRGTEQRLLLEAWMTSERASGHVSELEA